MSGVNKCIFLEDHGLPFILESLMGFHSSWVVPFYDAHYFWVGEYSFSQCKSDFHRNMLLVHILSATVDRETF